MLTQRLFGGFQSPESRLRKAALIACDVDGTLLNRDEMVGVRTISLIDSIVSLGVRFVLITRRHHQATELYAEELRLQEPVISLDGALVRQLDGAILFTVPFDQEFALDIIDEIQGTENVECCAVTSDRLLLSDADMFLPSHYHHWNIETTVASNFEGAKGDILEVIATGNFHAVNHVFDYLTEKMRPGELKIKLYESHSRRDIWHVEVRSAAATKYRALQRLVGHGNVRMAEVIGIGDHYNDVEFCKAAGYVAVPKNAVREMKELADFVTKHDCLDEGINEFLEHFLLVRRGGATGQNPPSGGRPRSR